MKKTYLILIIAFTATKNDLIAQNDTAGTSKGRTQLSYTSKYDFVQGDKIIAYEDFGSVNLGDFPLKWNTNASAEVVTVDNIEGKWLKMAEKGVFHPEFITTLPDNFTFEFDLGVNDANYFNSLCLNIANLKKPADFVDYAYLVSIRPEHAVHLEFRAAGNGADGVSKLVAGKAGVPIIDNAINFKIWDVSKNKFAHISLWRQGLRLRVYLNGEKIWDNPRAFEAGSKYNAITYAFYGPYTKEDYYLLSNIRLAIGAPDTRNKLLTEGKFVTSGIHFDVNSDKIKPDSYGILKEVAVILKENEAVKIKITGHTDSDGDDAKNMELSKRRAESVKNALMNEFQIPGSRMETDGKGESMPVSQNDTPAGKAQNRRVEFLKIVNLKALLLNISWIPLFLRIKTNCMTDLSRKKFLQYTASAGAAVLLSSLETFAIGKDDKKLKVAIIGCGSVSGSYIPKLLTSKMIEIVSLCDIKYDRALERNQTFKVNAKTYHNIDEMLNGEPFDMMITLTDMQVHEGLNRKAIVAGKHVWSEKPMANTYAAGKELLELARSKKLRFWGAPAVVNSPQFEFMSKKLQSGELGRISSAHGQYGHTGPTWSAFFYEKGGGSMPDLGVYNMASLTGLLGPAKSIMAMLSIVTPERTVDDKGKIKVEAEDNAHLLLEHDNNIISHVMCGFNFYDRFGHQAKDQRLHSIQIYGSEGNMRLIGYDWETNGVAIDSLKTNGEEQLQCTDKGGYEWREGAMVVGESMLKGIEPRINVEHALHVLEIIEAARKSQETGMRIKLQSKFPWPMV